jgi:hypothetical protein
MRLPQLLLPDLVQLEAQADPGPMGPTFAPAVTVHGRVRLGNKVVKMGGGQGENLTVVAAGTCALDRACSPGDRLSWAGVSYRVLTVTPKRPPVSGPGTDAAAWWEVTLV